MVLISYPKLPESDSGMRFPSPLIVPITVSLASPLTDTAVSLAPIRVASTVYVKSLTGTCTLKFNGTDAPAVTPVAGEIRNDLWLTNLYISTAGSGTSIVLEVHGR
jgi:hypothetical protein